MPEQLYRFVDKTGHCFAAFQASKATPPADDIDKIIDAELAAEIDDGESTYRKFLGVMLSRGELFSVGDMMSFKQDLLDAGFKWGTDFYVVKVKGKDDAQT